MADNNSQLASPDANSTSTIVKLLVAILLTVLIYLLIVDPTGTCNFINHPRLAEGLQKAGGYRLFLLVYLVTFFLARHFWISIPGRNHLEAELYGLEIRLKTVTDDKQELAKKIQNEIIAIRHSIKGHPFRQFIFGNTGKKIACWRRYHEIERLAIELLPQEALRQRLVMVSEDLSLFNSGGAVVLRDNIHKTLSPPKPDMELMQELVKQAEEKDLLSPDNVKGILKKMLATQEVKQPEPELMRYQLVEAMKHIDDDRDNIYQYLADWQNKASYLIGITIMIVLFIFSQPHNILFYFGMIGGLLAKLRGVINRNNIPADYGVSWATLFLTPLVGGITGWVSILLLNLIKTMGWLNMDKLLAMTWGGNETAPSALALAMVFGYSATLFEKVLDMAQGEMEKKSKILKN